jgi:hypothetical protein
MGRPKIVKPGEVETKESPQVEETPVESVMTDTALGIRQNKEKGTFELVIIKFNVDTNEAKIEEVKHIGIDKRVATFKFKEWAVRLGIVKEG